MEASALRCPARAVPHGGAVRRSFRTRSGGWPGPPTAGVERSGAARR